VDEMYRQFGQRLKGFRQAAKLTQARVATDVGLSRTSITNIERGQQHVMLHQVLLLARSVRVSPAQLLYGQDASLEDLVPRQQLAKLRESHPEDELDAIKRALNSAAARRPQVTQQEAS